MSIKIVSLHVHVSLPSCLVSAPAPLIESNVVLFNKAPDVDSSVSRRVIM